ncbi:uncharacterized protein V6R79_000320 [Siganus canaliculatus]
MKLLIVVLSALVFVVSSCPGGEFRCASGECLPASLVCDFKTDYKNGTDEEFCGSCNFEHHSCGWNDTSDDSYGWKRQMANISSVPGVDHTTGSAQGHVMHVDSRQESDFMSLAKMEYFVGRQAALGCRISFWYHIFDNETTYTSYFKLSMVRGSTDTGLFQTTKSNTEGWENQTVLIGNWPGEYKLKFSFDPPVIGRRDVMVDDISFDYCAEGDIPPGSDQLSCDFENDTCSWYSDYTASLLWKRTKGGFNEDPVEEDYHMLIKASSSIDASSNARLVSLPQPAGQTICVSFWYYIFGSSIGSLKFITKLSDEAEKVVWIRNGTHGKKWRFADLTFKSDKPIQFIIEAVTGGRSGSIAIDDINVFSSETGSCPAERECTFQGSLCGLVPHPSSNFSWSRITGTSQPLNDSGPATDHTLMTDQGYYLSAQLWNHPVGSRVAVMTAVMEPTAPEGECLMFWYYMEGSDVGELNVYLQTTDSPAYSEALWTQRRDQGKHWRHGRVTLISTDSTYQVVFEAVVGDEPRRDIAIDDLTVANGACPPQGFCDFEMDFCGWVSNSPSEFKMDWNWIPAGGYLVPSEDHTTNTDLGHLAVVMPTEYDTEQIAHLESETMEAVDQACLEFFYQVCGYTDDRPSYITLTMFVKETEGLRPIWSTKGMINGSWIQARLDYNSSVTHQIVLEANATTDHDTFALDDIHIIRDRSCDEKIPSTTSSPVTTTTSAPASAMDCNFEQGLCNWVQGSSDDLNWAVTQGLEVDQQWDGPQYDHTLENDQGFFLLLNGSGSKDGERAVISVPVTAVTSEICVGFWYHMLGPSVAAVDLLVETNSSEELVWTREGTQNPEWTNAQVTITMNDTMQLRFAGHRNTNSEGFIAIDDITVREGLCLDQNVCGFDSGSCGFENSVSHIGRWIRQKASKSEVDHSYGTENGYYMTVLMSNPSQTEEAHLLTPELTSATEMCVRFWYWLPAASSSILTVHVQWSGELGDALWQRSGASTSGWEVAEVTVFAPAKFYVVFRTVHVPGTNSTVKLDDISVTDRACGPPASCDFESGLCTWVNIPNDDGHDWVLATGGFQGPSTDHTTQTPDGQFLLSSSLHQSHSSVAQVLSEWIHLRSATSCLTLWYQMDSSDSGALKVSLRSRSDEDLMFNVTNSAGVRSWSKFSQSVERDSPFQVLIEAETNDRGFIAVDDVTVTEGFCQVNETSAEFVGCSFENGTCGWNDASVGQCQWIRGRNSSENIGPSVDHTAGTTLGWYMAVTSKNGPEISPATMQSPTMKQASATCTLHFYYNMFGEDLEELRVVLKEGPRTTTLWWLAGNHGDSWRLGEVRVGRMPDDFTILFEASRTFTALGHIAIDDIDFTNCTLPEPQPVCPDDLFSCNNSVCVEQSQVCDFNDDCGDRSDENDCELQGFVEGCSFEQGLCSWAKTDVDTPGAEWTLGKGQEDWPKHGPPRDHTQNSAAGCQYVTPGTHLSEKGQTSEILSKTLLPSSNCTVRFFHFSLNDAAATLTAQSRTLQSGTGDSVLWRRENSSSYSWQRAEVTFSSQNNSKIVFRYEHGDGPRGLAALDDISFSRECLFDPDNNDLPGTIPTSPPATSSPSPPDTSTTTLSPPTTSLPTSPSHTTLTPSTSPAPVNPCEDNEFFCWQSTGQVCIQKTLRCDYHLDCPKAEDEDGCGLCTFESGQCQWSDTSVGANRWQRQKASGSTDPPTDHTTHTGYYMKVNFSQGSTQSEARLQSPPLPPSSAYCQIMFHFHIRAESAGSLRVLMQQAEGSEAILWSRSHNTVSHWTAEQLPLGLHQQPYKIWFSSTNEKAKDDIVAVDDISFLNCEESYKPPALSAYGCSFEEGLCEWVQGAEETLDWLHRSGVTATPNTGPAGDHSTGKGKYLYINSSPPSVKGTLAQLKSLLLPPAGQNGYCFTFWHHMFGATVGSLRVILQTSDPLEKTTVWQKSGNQGNEWHLAQIHVTLAKIHQVILEATVGGEAGDIAIDDIALISGPCSSSDTSIGLAVGLTLLAGVIIAIVLFLLSWKQCKMKRSPVVGNGGTEQNNDFGLFDKVNGMTDGPESSSSFFNNLYDRSAPVTETSLASTDA